MGHTGKYHSSKTIHGRDRKIMEQIRAIRVGKRHGKNEKRQRREKIERMDRSDTTSRMEINT